MASPPPPDRIRATPPTAQEASRFWIINGLRLSGVALVVIGLLVLNQAIQLPRAVGWAMVPIGLVDVFVVPLVLSRKWRSPPA